MTSAHAGGRTTALFYRAALPLSGRPRTAQRDLRRHRASIGSLRRTLNPGSRRSDNPVRRLDEDRREDPQLAGRTCVPARL